MLGVDRVYQVVAGEVLQPLPKESRFGFVDDALWRARGPCHMWTPPFGKGSYERLCKTVGCSHMSGLCARLLWPLALMISAD
jgi:hypothetical protein